MGAALAAPAQAETGDRCRILGPVVVSSWFGLLESTGQKERDETRAAAATLETIASTYKTLGCPNAALAATLDCISEAAMSGQMIGGPAAVALRCMAEADLPRP